MTTNMTEKHLKVNNSEMSKINEKAASVDETTETKQPIEAAKKQLKKKKYIINCNICREKLLKYSYIRCPICKQYFCKFCIENWLLSVKNNRICPLCAKKWDDIFICNNLPLGFVVNQLGLRVYGLYSSDYEFEPINEHSHESHYSDTEDDENHENHSDNHETDENHENHSDNHETDETDENHSDNHETDETDENHSDNQNKRENILDFILNTSNLDADPDTVNLIRGLLLSDLFGH